MSVACTFHPQRLFTPNPYYDFVSEEGKRRRGKKGHVIIASIKLVKFEGELGAGFAFS